MAKGGMKYQKMPCTKCGADRVLGVACDDCGTRAPVGEVNADVVRRRTAVAQVDDRLAAHVPTSGELPSLDELSRAVGAFTLAVPRFAETSSSGAVEKLVQVVGTFTDLRSRCLLAPTVRPHLALRLALLESTERLVALWPLYRATLTAPSILEAQRLNTLAQASLDSAAGAMRLYGERLDQVATFDGEPNDTLIERTVRLLTAGNDGTLLDIAAMGAEHARQLTGHAVHPGAGAQFLVQRTVALVLLDYGKFEQTISEAASFARQADFSALLQSNHALEGIAASQRRLAEAVVAFEAILTSEKNEETVFRRLLKYHAEIYEEVGGPLFAWYLLLSGTKSKPYEKLIDDGVTALAKSIDSVPDLARWFDGRDAFLRNAPSHAGGLSISDGVVHITLKSVKVSHPIEWVVDRVYAFLESLMATSWALTNELERRDIDLPISQSDQAYLGISGFPMAKLYASMNFGALECRDEDGDWYFSLPAGDEDAVTKAIGLMTVSQSARSVTVERSGSGPLLHMPLEAWESYAHSIEKERSEAAPVALVELRSRCTRDGSTILRETDVQFAVGVVGIHFLRGDATLVPLLRRLDGIAVEHNYEKSHDRIGRVLQWLRSNDAVEARRLNEEFLAWVGEVPELPIAYGAVVSRTSV